MDGTDTLVLLSFNSACWACHTAASFRAVVRVCWRMPSCSSKSLSEEPTRSLCFFISSPRSLLRVHNSYHGRHNGWRLSERVEASPLAIPSRFCRSSKNCPACSFFPARPDIQTLTAENRPYNWGGEALVLYTDRPIFRAYPLSICHQVQHITAVDHSSGKAVIELQQHFFDYARSNA